MIALLHLFNQYGHRTYWDVGVEFFFIVSGWLMAEAIEKKKLTTLEYTMKRIKRLYPEYLLAYIVCVIFLSSFFEFSVSDFIHWIKSEGIFELTMTHYWLWGNASIANVVTWYVSVLILAGTLVYFLAVNCPTVSSKILFPSLIVFFYTYTYFKYGDFLGAGKILGYGHVCFWRGAAELCIGCLLYRISGVIQGVLDKKIVQCIGFLSLTLVVILSHFYGYYYLYVILIAIGVITSFNTPLTFTNRCITFLDRISYSIYLNHIIFRSYIMPRFFAELSIKLVLAYLISITVFSIVMHYVVKGIAQIVMHGKCQRSLVKE